jgi:hypothetical protein
MKHLPAVAFVNRISPLLAAALLMALLAVGGLDGREPDGVEVYMAEVRAAIDAIPHRIGAAVGADAEPTPAAIKLLAPNKILQRRFVDPLTGARMSLMIVHCGDARDMFGHYPPVCYPAHGWISGSRRSIPVEISGTQTVAVVYEFSRVENMAERSMTVVNFFIVPGKGPQFAPDMEAVQRVAGTKAAARLGVAQIQLVLDGTPSHEEQMLAIRDVLPVLEPVARAIGRGVEI